MYSSNKNMRLVEWLDIVKVAKQKASRSDESSKTIENVKKHIIKFCGESTKMVDIDKKFCPYPQLPPHLPLLFHLSSEKDHGNQGRYDTW